MARPIEQIQAQIIETVAAQPELTYVDTTGTTRHITENISKRAIWRLWTHIVAVSHSILEQLLDLFEKRVEDKAAKAPPTTPAWLQDQAFKFQYSNDNPQIVKLINFATSYPVIDPNLRIVTRCSVTTNLSNSVIIKVAKGDPPTALSVDEKAALQSFYNIVGSSGITYSVVSLESDKIYIAASIYYTGLFSSVIKANVIKAINDYLAKVDFNGKLKINDVELAIRNVLGVTDVVFENVSVRADTSTFTDGTALILNSSLISRLWNTVSGYVVQETISGKTFLDTLNFIPE